MMNSIAYVEISTGDLLYKRQATAVESGVKKGIFTNKNKEVIAEVEYRGNFVPGKFLKLEKKRV